VKTKKLFPIYLKNISQSSGLPKPETPQISGIRSVTILITEKNNIKKTCILRSLDVVRHHKTLLNFTKYGKSFLFKKYFFFFFFLLLFLIYNNIWLKTIDFGENVAVDRSQKLFFKNTEYIFNLTKNWLQIFLNATI